MRLDRFYQSSFFGAFCFSDLFLKRVIGRYKKRSGNSLPGNDLWPLDILHYHNIIRFSPPPPPPPHTHTRKIWFPLKIFSSPRFLLSPWYGPDFLPMKLNLRGLLQRGVVQQLKLPRIVDTKSMTLEYTNGKIVTWNQVILAGMLTGVQGDIR